jgi:hypothetical protein
MEETLLGNYHQDRLEDLLVEAPLGVLLDLEVQA